MNLSLLCEEIGKEILDHEGENITVLIINAVGASVRYTVKKSVCDSVLDFSYPSVEIPLKRELKK